MYMYLYIYICIYVCILYIYKRLCQQILYTMKKLSLHHLHHAPRCLSFHKAILVMTRSANCFYDYICVIPNLLLQGLSVNIFACIGHSLLFLIVYSPVIFF